MIDAGTQSSGEAGYGTDVRPDRCARCQRGTIADGDLCAPCRAFLLEDSDVDPRVGPTLTTEQVVAGVEAFRQAWSQIADTVGQVVDAVCEAFGAPDLTEVQRIMEDAKAKAVLPSSFGLEPRARELSLLDQHPRSHRRTNRWGPPPGRRRP